MKHEKFEKTLRLKKESIVNLSGTEKSLDREALGKVKGGGKNMERATIIPVICS
jgi:hypothetical protein